MEDKGGGGGGGVEDRIIRPSSVLLPHKSLLAGQGDNTYTYIAPIDTWKEVNQYQA